MPGKLTVTNLKTFGLGPVSLEVEPGEIVCVGGNSGSGKSLMLKAMADIVPHEGQVFLGRIQAESFSAPEWRKLVGLLPAQSAWWKTKVRDHYRNPENTDFRCMGFGPEIMDKDVRMLSSGEKQRLSILRLLENRPEALLLDEPTANLDPGNTERVERIISEYARAYECPVIWVSHDHEQSARMASRFFTMENGILTEE